MLLLVGFLAFSISSCKDDDDDDEQVDTPTLYDRVGGTEMVTDPVNGGQIQKGRLTLRAVVDSAGPIIVTDPRLAGDFQILLAELNDGNTSGLAALSKNLTDFFVVATSGGEVGSYTGLNMKDAHDPAINDDRLVSKSTDAEMDAFIEDVGKSLAKNGVTDQALINDLVALLETLRGDIVQE
ncbi:hypothetical protein V9L05_11795 [Bernardetia sp. Wsw4-3y2]